MLRYSVDLGPFGLLLSIEYRLHLRSQHVELYAESVWEVM
jgi:hypothetical protein